MLKHVNYSFGEIEVLVGSLEIGCKGDTISFEILNDFAVSNNGRFYVNEDLVNTVSEFRPFSNMKKSKKS